MSKTILWLLVLVLTVWGVLLTLRLSEPVGYFSHVPAEKIHTMTVWEDGSFQIVYHDETSEEGCLPGGLCNDK